MIFKFKQNRSGNKKQSGMPDAVFAIADYAHEANTLFEQNDGYFDHRDGDDPEQKRWEPVEQADGFEDEVVTEIANTRMTPTQRIWSSKSLVVSVPEEELKEFWIIRNA
jgi:hypothetical protein